MAALQWGPGEIPKLDEKQYRAEYDIIKVVETPQAGFARVEAFLRTKNNALYAIVPRRPVREIVLDDVEATGDVRVSLLESIKP